MARLAKSFLLRSPLGPALVFRYKFMFSPAQLGFLCSCLEETAKVPGNLFELGCASGLTTVFLNKQLDDMASSKRYLCLDNFQGFTQRDSDYEREKRAKSDSFDEFRRNSRVL